MQRGEKQNDYNQITHDFYRNQETQSSNRKPPARRIIGYLPLSISFPNLRNTQKFLDSKCSF
jgi:hypothetical protein